MLKRKLSVDHSSNDSGHWSEGTSGLISPTNCLDSFNTSRGHPNNNRAPSVKETTNIQRETRCSNNAQNSSNGHLVKTLEPAGNKTTNGDPKTQGKLTWQIPESESGPAVVIGSLIKALRHCGHADFVESASGTLYNISRDERSLEIILKLQGIPVLISLLHSEVGTILILACSILHKLLSKQDEAAKAVELAGGVRKLVALLKRPEQNLLAVVVDCLRILASKSEEAKLVILQCDGPRTLVRILKEGTSENLLWMTSRLLRVLSSNSRWKAAIIAVGGIKELTKLLCSHSNDQVLFNCLATLKNLSDIARDIELLDSLIKYCVDSVQACNSNATSYCVSILVNLTNHNSRNRGVAFKYGAIGALINRILDPRTTSDNIVEGAIYALMNMSSKHRWCVAARRELRYKDIFRVLFYLLQPPYRWPIVKAVVEMVKNWIICPEGSNSFRDWGVLNCLINALETALQSVHELSGGAPELIYRSEFVTSVRINDCIEGILLALCNLAKRNTLNRKALCCQKLIIISINLLSHALSNIQDAAVALLCQILLGHKGEELLKLPDTLQAFREVFHLGQCAASRVARVIEKVAPRTSSHLIYLISVHNSASTERDVIKGDENYEATSEPSQRHDQSQQTDPALIDEVPSAILEFANGGDTSYCFINQTMFDWESMIYKLSNEGAGEEWPDY